MRRARSEMWTIRWAAASSREGAYRFTDYILYLEQYAPSADNDKEQKNRRGRDKRHVKQVNDKPICWSPTKNRCIDKAVRFTVFLLVGEPCWLTSQVIPAKLPTKWITGAVADRSGRVIRRSPVYAEEANGKLSRGWKGEKRAALWWTHRT